MHPRPLILHVSAALLLLCTHQGCRSATPFPCVCAHAPYRDMLRFSICNAGIGSAESRTLDPLKTFHLQYFVMQHQMFETLTAVDTRTQTMRPVLATSWDRRSPTEYRFHLRRGVRFHNGDPMTAASVKFSLDLMCDPRNRFPGRFLFKSISGVTIVDDYTCDITLREPDALLLRKLAMIGFILPEQYYRSVGRSYFTRYPVGTGPYRFFYGPIAKEKSEIHFIANETYWGQSPCFRELVYVGLPCDRQWQALADEDIDLLVTQAKPPRIPGIKRLTVLHRLALRETICLMNTDRPGPLQDHRVRAALQHAVSRSDIIDGALGGYGKPLYSTILTGSLAKPVAGPVYAENPDMARALLDQAGVTGGLHLRTLVFDIQPAAAVAARLTQQLARVGVALDITMAGRDDIIREIVSPKLRGQYHPSDWDLCLVPGWPVMFGTGAQFYFSFLHSHGPFNFGIGIQDGAEIDRLHSELMQAADDEALRSGIAAFDAHVMQEAFLLPLFQTELIYAMQPDILFDPGVNDYPLRFARCTAR